MIGHLSFSTAITYQPLGRSSGSPVEVIPEIASGSPLRVPKGDPEEEEEEDGKLIGNHHFNTHLVDFLPSATIRLKVQSRVLSGAADVDGLILIHTNLDHTNPIRLKVTGR